MDFSDQMKRGQPPILLSDEGPFPNSHCNPNDHYRAFLKNYWRAQEAILPRGPDVATLLMARLSGKWDRAHLPFSPQGHVDTKGLLAAVS